MIPSVMVASISNISAALTQFKAQSSGDDLVSIAASRGGTSQSVSAGDINAAFARAEKSEAKQLADIAKDPTVKRDLARYASVVKSATSIDDVLDDPIARKVFLKAVGLGTQTDFVAMAKKALNSDPTDAESVAVKLSGVNPTWLSTVQEYRFDLLGIGSINSDTAIQGISEDYIAEKRLDALDQQVPGLGSALLFKKLAPTLDTSLKILGSALGREVVVTALGLPKQIAGQSLEAQQAAIESRLDPEKLANADFADKLVRRYLINLNGGTSGVTA